MKTQKKCLNCIHHSSNSDDDFMKTWALAFLFSHKCETYYPRRPWVVAFLDEMDKLVHDTESSKIIDIFAFIAALFTAGPLCAYFACIGHITKKTLFLCAVNQSYRPKQ